MTPLRLAPIRPAEAQDLADIGRVERLASVLYAPYGLADRLSEIVTPLDEVARGIEARTAWVADEPGEGLVGFALAHVAGEDVHLDEIDVVPARLRRGLGSALLEVVLADARARGARRLTLLTVDFVPWTLGFYAHHGFRVLAVRELDERLASALSIEPSRLPPGQRSFDGRIILTRNLQAPDVSAIQREP